MPAEQHPHCHWTVIIDESYPPLPIPAAAAMIGATRGAGLVLADPDPAEPGRGDYSGPLLADLRFDEWSRSALLRIAEEVCLQGQLLTLSFLAAVRQRASDEERVLDIGRHQFTGIAGLAAERIHRLFDLGTGLDAVASVLSLHPALLPSAYVGASIEVGVGGDQLVVTLDRSSDAVADGGWSSLLSGTELAPLDAAVRAVDPRYRCDALSVSADELVVGISLGDEAVKESPDVVMTRFSTGADFRFEDRGTPVELTRSVPGNGADAPRFLEQMP